MKRLKSFLIVAIMAIFAICPRVFTNKNATAASSLVGYDKFSEDLELILDDFCEFKTRIAGSDNEKKAAEYIYNYLLDVPYLNPISNSSTKIGVQEFTFLSDYTGNYQKSQNIVFRYSPATDSKKMVILGCHYDAPAYFDEVKGEYVSNENDALNASAGSVATLLMLASNLSTQKLPFNVEFVFFGAGESSFAGSDFYVDGISNEEANNILCMINIDKVSLGDELYFYIDEIETSFSKYITSLFETARIGTRKVNVSNLSKALIGQNELGLTYSHIGMNSDNIKFMKRKIATVNLFAGAYSDGLVLGRREYKDKANVTYSKFDTRAYISATYGSDVVAKNLYRTFETVEQILMDENFLANTTGSFNQTNWFYQIFANQKLVLLISVIAFILVIIIAMYVHYKLTVKSYFANVEMEFLSSVVKITEHIDAEGKDKNVPKVISQVIANDIKKNKTLNPEKKDKDKES